MRFIERVRTQPDVLASSRQAVLGALKELPMLSSDQTVALVGMGASALAAQSAATAWREAGLRAIALPAAELLISPPTGIDYVIAISESGQSTETVAALERIKYIKTIALTNDLASPLAEASDYALPLACGDDSDVYTVGYTSTLQALGLLGDLWGNRPTDWSAVPGLVAEVLTGASGAISDAGYHFKGVGAVDLVADAAQEATAGEGALMLREGARLFTAFHETRTYLHGPMEALEPLVHGCVVVGNQREIELAQATSLIGCPTLLLTTDKVVDNGEHLDIARVPVTSGLQLCILNIVALQLLTSELAAGRDLHFNNFRYSQTDTKLPRHL